MAMAESAGVRKVVTVAFDVAGGGGWIVRVEAGRERLRLGTAAGAREGMGVSGMREMEEEEERRGDLARDCGGAVGASLRLRRLREGVSGIG